MAAATKQRHAYLQQQILRSARERIEREGLADLSVRKVTRDIGCAVGMVYKLYENLDDLVLHVNDITLDSIYSRMKAQVMLQDDPMERLLACAGACIEYSHEHPMLWHALFEHRMPSGKPLPEWYLRKVNQIFLLLQEAVMPLVGHQRHKASRASKLIWSGVSGITNLSYFGKMDVPEKEAEKQLLASFIRDYLAGVDAPMVSQVGKVAA